MSDLVIPRGDYGFNLAFTVQEDDGTVYVLTGYTITMKVWAKDIPGSPVVEDTCDIDIAASGTCHYTVKSGDFDTAGEYLIELELSKTGLAVESTRYYTLEVKESA